jgi:protein SCO1/2
VTFAVNLVSLMLSLPAFGGQADITGRHPATGVVLSVDAPARTFVASIDSIPGVMAAMTMPFKVRDAKEFAGVAPGAVIDFTLVVDKTSSYAEGLRVRRYQNLEQDPMAASRLALFRQVANGRPARMLAVGDAVPDFTLIDQHSQPVSLSSFKGKVVAVNFMYTTCQLPDFCIRLVNHFAVLQKRLAARLGRDLILLTISFDPERDRPDVLDHYAAQWKPVPGTWHFLTGTTAEVGRVLDLFGVSAFLNEGLMDHSLRTVVIDRRGALAATLEGNRYSSDQLGDLVQTILDARSVARGR